MKLNKNSWHYKMWAGSFDAGMAPYNTDLCRYCHRVFWQLLARLFLVFAICLLVGMGGFFLFYKGLYQHPLAFFEVLAGIVAVFGCLFLYLNWISGSRSNRTPKTLVGKYARAAKQGVCPLVEFTNSEED